MVFPLDLVKVSPTRSCLLKVDREVPFGFFSPTTLALVGYSQYPLECSAAISPQNTILDGKVQKGRGMIDMWKGRKRQVPPSMQGIQCHLSAYEGRPVFLCSNAAFASCLMHPRRQLS